MKIVARGWEWEISDRPTAWISLTCISCGRTVTYPSNHYKRSCSLCGGNNGLISYVRKVKQVKR